HRCPAPLLGDLPAVGLPGALARNGREFRSKHRRPDDRHLLRRSHEYSFHPALHPRRHAADETHAHRGRRCLCGLLRCLGGFLLLAGTEEGSDGGLSVPLACPSGWYTAVMRIAYITAGAAGMYCGSCLHDNTLVTALIAQGHDALLIPTYTPTRTDEPDVSQKRVFFGGINVYL